jgi:phenylacetate-CoA oxygenase, PaaG subunit
MTQIRDDAREEECIKQFCSYVHNGGKVEATDWMPAQYRQALIRFIEMHANSELMGVLPERDWILRAPTIQRKLALTAKIQDEAGHAELLYRLVEDLGKPRSASLDDLVAGKGKFHNTFHYRTETWADVGIIAWLVDAAAIVSQHALRDSSYAPYARTMQKICWEESFHMMHGRDIVITLLNGTAQQHTMVQESLVRWWPRLMVFHGPNTPAEQDRDIQWRIKTKTNEELRQEFLQAQVPRLREVGLNPPDPALRYDAEQKRWCYSEPDWAELRAIAHNQGPASAERIAFRRMTYEEGQWVRDLMARYQRQHTAAHTLQQKEAEG